MVETNVTETFSDCFNINFRAIKEIRHLEADIQKWQVLVDKVRHRLDSCGFRRSSVYEGTLAFLFLLKGSTFKLV